MILLKIKQYIIDQKEVTLPQLAAHFDLPENVMMEMVDRWIQKKVIEKITVSCGSLSNQSNCGSCSTGCAIKDLQPVSRSTQILYRSI